MWSERVASADGVRRKCGASAQRVWSECAAGVQLIKQGAEGDKFFIIKDGLCDISIDGVGVVNKVPRMDNKSGFEEEIRHFGAIPKGVPSLLVCSPVRFFLGAFPAPRLAPSPPCHL